MTIGCTIIVLSSSPELHFAPGPPCLTEFKTYKFKIKKFESYHLHFALPLFLLNYWQNDVRGIFFRVMDFIFCYCPLCFVVVIPSRVQISVIPRKVTT